MDKIDRETAPMRYVALLAQMLFARGRGDGEEVEDEFLDLLDGLWKSLTDDEQKWAEQVFARSCEWSKDLPTVTIIQSRHDSEHQPPRYWWKNEKPDGHGNEADIIELRVMDGELFCLDPVWRAWRKFTPEEWKGCWLAPCFMPHHPHETKKEEDKAHG